MLYRITADVVLLVHLGFVAVVVLGGLLAMRWRWVPWIQLPAAAWGIYVELSGTICPLTPLELRLRLLAGQAGYSGGFIDHYLLPLLYPEGLTRRVQLALALVVVLANAGSYAWVLSRRRQGR